MTTATQETQQPTNTHYLPCDREHVLRVSAHQATHITIETTDKNDPAYDLTISPSPEGGTELSIGKAKLMTTGSATAQPTAMPTKEPWPDAAHCKARIKSNQAQMRRIRKSIHNLEKGNEYLVNLMFENGPSHQNFDEWQDYWTANTSRIKFLTNSLARLQADTDSLATNPQYLAQTQFEKAERQLEQAKRRYARAVDARTQATRS